MKKYLIGAIAIVVMTATLGSPVWAGSTTFVVSHRPVVLWSPGPGRAACLESRAIHDRGYDHHRYNHHRGRPVYGHPVHQGYRESCAPRSRSFFPGAWSGRGSVFSSGIWLRW